MTRHSKKTCETRAAVQPSRVRTSVSAYRRPRPAVCLWQADAHTHNTRMASELSEAPTLLRNLWIVTVVTSLQGMELHTARRTAEEWLPASCDEARADTRAVHVRMECAGAHRRAPSRRHRRLQVTRPHARGGTQWMSSKMKIVTPRPTADSARTPRCYARVDLCRSRAGYASLL